MANECIPGRYAFATADRYLGDYYRTMDAFCLTSNQEGFSLALLEAMWCERPVVVTPVGCVPEIIRDRVNGIIVEDNGVSIAAAVRLVEEFPHWARGIAAEGRQFADRNGHALRMALQYEDLLESLWADRYGAVA
jgi:glycosyltransferase involved in cell wall biosynthesis